MSCVTEPDEFQSGCLSTGRGSLFIGTMMAPTSVSSIKLSAPNPPLSPRFFPIPRKKNGSLAGLAGFLLSTR